MSWVPPIGSEFAGYRLESLLGHGGMSIVYRAAHLSLGRTVALKLLAPQLSEDQEFRERFTQESRLAASLDHPNIIPIYEAGEEDEVFWIAMRYVAGSDAKNLLKRVGSLDSERALEIVVPVASALAAAHGKGLVHRDVKPANILLASEEGAEDETHVYLSDFGVAKKSATRALTKTGVFVGTAEYASPEQIEGKELDGRSDIYSLGCVLYECLTGAPTFDKDSEIALMYAHLLEPPPSVTAMRPDLTAEIDEVVAKAMAKSPDDRFATAREFAMEARSVLGRGRHASTTPAAATAPRPAPETVLSESTQRPPAMAAPPPPSNGAGKAAGAGRDWRRLAMLLGAAAVIALAAIPGIILLAGDDDNKAAGTPATTTQTTGTTSEPTPPTSLLEVLVPTQIARDCTKSPDPRPGAVETNICTPTEGAPTSDPNEFELSFFANARQLEEAYRREKDSLNEQACGGTVGERVWIHQTTGRRAGRRICGVDDNGAFAIVWTHEKLDATDHVDLLAIAREPGRSPTTFTSWWGAVNDILGKCRPKVSEESCTETIDRLARQ